jgi:hypothetical protein
VDYGNSINFLEADQLFCPDQIICIDLDNLRLFAELIQMIPARDRLWARPLALAQQEDYDLHLLHDLRESPQLILPPALFREAWDTEVLPLMTELFRLEVQAKPEPKTELISRQALHAFIAMLWHEPVSI